MTLDPRRIAEDDPEFARLFEASKEDGPSPRQAEEAARIARSVATAPRWSSRSLRLGGALFVVGSVVLGTFVVHETRTSLPKRGDDRNIVAPSSELLPAPPSLDVEPSAASAQPPEAAVTSPDRLPNAKPVTAKRNPAPTDQSSFDEELRLLSQARGGLESNDIAACLRAVDEYEARFPRRLFSQEMAVLRIEALAKSGERARAHALAESFLAANPQSPYAARARTLAARTVP